ncbi:MAG: exonuclease SbcCD subunit D [Culicoidibacterales bacterium]
MKFIHLSDLHIGKRVNDFSMIEDQAYILTKILNIIDEQQPDGVFISGDVYDKAVPSAEAVALFDDFLYRLAQRELQTYVISGNHDSPERIAFGGRLMNQSGVYMSPVYHKDIAPITVHDEHGAINIYLLPFIKPTHVRAQFPEASIESYTQAMQVALDYLQVDSSKRNVLLTHQFVAGSLRSESEELSVGGSDNVAVDIFEAFDYVALGHLHKPQHVGRETIRYCGTPLKYSFSEANDVKSVTVVEMGAKGEIEITTVPLVPKRDLKQLRGTYDDLMLKSNYDSLNLDDYYRITLIDEHDVPDALQKLRTVYPNIMKLDYDNARTQALTLIEGASAIEQKTPLELVGEFYEQQNNQALSSEQAVLLTTLIEQIWGEK